MTAVLKRGLSADAIEKRKASIGGSDANTIMSGDDKAILHLWEVKTGRAEPEDLSWVLPVQMGIQTEPLNRKWFEHVTGKTLAYCPHGSHRRTHPEYPWMTCNLDGIVEDEAAVLECKHVNAFSNIEEVRQKYMPQLHHNMIVTGWRKAYLSIFIGTLKHEWCEVEYDGWYAGELMDREIAFWKAVQDREPPVHLGDPVPVPAFTDMRSMDMEGNNAWADAAHDWLANKKQAGWFKKAEKNLKTLVEADVREAFGHGVRVKRAKNNSLRISELKE